MKKLRIYPLWDQSDYLTHFLVELMCPCVSARSEDSTERLLQRAEPKHQEREVRPGESRPPQHTQADGCL